MRNKLICLLSILCIFTLTATADDITVNSSSDWGAFQGNESAWDGQKIIKNKEYEDIVKELERRKNSGKIRAQKKAGDAVMKDMEGGEHDFLSSFVEQYPLLNLTVPLVTKSGEIPVGHYKVIGKKINGKPYITLCQSYNVVAKIPVYETEDDFNMDEINFIKTEVVNDRILKIMYGSMAFNAYTYLNYHKNDSYRNF